MKYLVALLLLASPLTDLEEIAKVNSLKKKAKEAYVKGNYKQAVEHYTYLLDSMKVEDPNITLNLANAYYQLKDSANAVNNYNSLLGSKDRVVKSVAHQQLGVMADRAKKFEEALDHFKNAIKADPSNDEARYNYEMLKKMLDEQKKNQDQNKDQQDQKDQNKDQQNKDEQKQQDQKNKDQQNKDQQQQQEQKDKEGEQKENEQEQQNKEEQQKDAQDQKEKKGEEGEEKKDQQPKPEEGEKSEEQKAKEEQMNSLSEKLKDMKISEEKAKMILEALKNNEIQYIQQNKRKATKRKDPNKPDW